MSYLYMQRLPDNSQVAASGLTMPIWNTKESTLRRCI